MKRRFLLALLGLLTFSPLLPRITYAQDAAPDHLAFTWEYLGVPLEN